MGKRVLITQLTQIRCMVFATAVTTIGDDYSENRRRLSDEVENFNMVVAILKGSLDTTVNLVVLSFNRYD